MDLLRIQDQVPCPLVQINCTRNSVETIRYHFSIVPNREIQTDRNLKLSYDLEEFLFKILANERASEVGLTRRQLLTGCLFETVYVLRMRIYEPLRGHPVKTLMVPFRLA